MTIRPAQTSDLDILNEISLSSKRHWGYPEDWIEGWKNDLTLTQEDLKSMGVLVICLGAEVVGFCAISETPSHYEIEHLWIVPQYMGKGYGKKLLKKALEMFTLGSKDTLVTADPHAEDFYRKYGFRTIRSVESTLRGRFLPVMFLESK